mmetsp:Transcript_12401/g.26790  ORF Transcript_12401/g.26790 Transcript_12401/m.26790 type:complete len:252 (-) Transcript_12401:1267-2022(-)
MQHNCWGSAALQAGSPWTIWAACASFTHTFTWEPQAHLTSRACCTPAAPPPAHSLKQLPGTAFAKPGTSWHALLLQSQQASWAWGRHGHTQLDTVWCLDLIRTITSTSSALSPAPERARGQGPLCCAGSGSTLTTLTAGATAGGLLSAGGLQGGTNWRCSCCYCLAWLLRLLLLDVLEQGAPGARVVRRILRLCERKLFEQGAHLRGPLLLETIQLLRHATHNGVVRHLRVANLGVCIRHLPLRLHNLLVL